MFHNTELNLTTYSTTNPSMMSFEVVSRQQCLDYVSSTTTTNYILMGLLLLIGVAMIIWVNREKFTWYRNMQTVKSLYSSDEMEKVGKEFLNGMFETSDTKEELKEKMEKDLVDIPTFKEGGK